MVFGRKRKKRMIGALIAKLVAWWVLLYLVFFVVIGARRMGSLEVGVYLLLLFGGTAGIVALHLRRRSRTRSL